jgi:hypothetical protein
MVVDDLQTPRMPASDTDEWAPEIEALLAEFGEVALCYSWLHSYSTRKYKSKYHHMSIPIIILSTLTGTANFAVDSYVPEAYQQGFSACVGGLNILCGVMGTLLSFLRYAELYEGHRVDHGLLQDSRRRNHDAIVVQLRRLVHGPPRLRA